MDLGCLDLGCIEVLEKHKDNNEVGVGVDSERKDGDSPISSDEPGISTSPKIRKSKGSKTTGISAHTSVNKSYSQMKKTNRKSSSPLNWFPRKKVDSYLKRKIRLLQEVGGMTSTLDETLGDSNPHYSRVLREKIAVREAACKAMEARKAAMVEASWCRILKAARIQSKEAEALLEEAEKDAAKAFEEAATLGVIMYDRPDCPRKPCEVESSSINMGGSTTHTVTASFETAFEVDKEVAAAVKAAFIRLANCPSCLNKDEHRDLLRKISQNPDINESNEEVSEGFSGCESDTRMEMEPEILGDDCRSQPNNHKMPNAEEKGKSKYRHPPDISSTKLIDMMFERLKCLQEDELASLATIVATCGLSDILLELENIKHHDSQSGIDYTLDPSQNTRRSSIAHTKNGQSKTKQVATELPGLDKFLVKHMSRLEREVQEAKNKAKNDSKGGRVEKNVEGSEHRLDHLNSTIVMSEAIPDLGSILVKHTSKLEKEIEVARKTSRKDFEMKSNQLGKKHDNGQGVPSLDKFLVKHVSRLEREVQEAKNKKSGPSRKSSASKSEFSSFEDVLSSHDMVNISCEEGSEVGKENLNLNKQVDEVLHGTVKEKVEMEHSGNQDANAFSMQTNLIDCSKKSSLTAKTMSRIERAKLETMEAFSLQDGKVRSESECSLDKILVKPVHRLEREKKQALTSGMNYVAQTSKKKHEWTDSSDCSLDSILVKPVHRLEREKQQALASGMDYGTRTNKKKHEWTDASNFESLDSVLVKHVSRLEKEKMELGLKDEEKKVTSNDCLTKNHTDSLDHILVKHQLRLEKDKLTWAQQQEDETKHVKMRQQARERELQEAWGGLSLGNSVRPHVSRLEKEKAAWIKAEEEERRQVRRGLET
ncbi:Oxoglutarate/iron-dependent dioxygenase [Thalictrum thalictroides]|uniref:Oxoglutarate/iron-dependent dioxygenase n=1 Tax=Thalictrum thalictroides TaxID=46969 RepID=A0A7J6VJ57_THATH|nr:Oxoglutarate/iron-dependent dioxygenase [Thalictrum thalictroides]